MLAFDLVANFFVPVMDKKASNTFVTNATNQYLSNEKL
jgi:hypothetical protein